jgi:hypothetical protein
MKSGGVVEALMTEVKRNLVAKLRKITAKSSQGMGCDRAPVTLNPRFEQTGSP